MTINADQEGMLAHTKLKVGGNIWANGGDMWANNYNKTSDISKKENIRSLTEDEVSSIQKLKPVAYNLKGKDKVDYGFIAQEVEKILPNVVTIAPDNTKGLSYDEIIPLMTGNLQKLNAKVGQDKLCIDDVCLTKEDLLRLKKSN
jgi:hypothetical protein